MEYRVASGQEALEHCKCRGHEETLDHVLGVFYCFSFSFYVFLYCLSQNIKVVITVFSLNTKDRSSLCAIFTALEHAVFV